jgi:hypothetical protein
MSVSRLSMNHGTRMEVPREHGMQELRAEDYHSYRIVINPIVLGSGRTMFGDIPEKMNLALKKTRNFTDGKIVSWYAPPT